MTIFKIGTGIMSLTIKLFSQTILDFGCNLRKGFYIFVILFAGSVFANEETDMATEARIKAILSDMTLEQKVGQMVQGEIKWVKPGDVSKYFLGSILNGGGSHPNTNRNPREPHYGRGSNDKNASIQDWLDVADEVYLESIDKSRGGAGIPIIWGTDAVHGHNNVIGATLFPHNIGLGAANDPELLKNIGEITAKEVAVTGIDWIFAPTVATVKDNRWGRTYEGYSSESDIVGRYARQIVEGIQGDDINELRSNPAKLISSAKHFIGDGGTYRGIDQGDTVLSLEDLLKDHGQGFYKALEADVQTIMASFNSWNGDKIHGNEQLLTDVLKTQLGFDGFVIGDWNGHGQVDDCTNRSCPSAINAGVDMIMVPEHWKPFLKNTIQQVRDGIIPISRIDDAVSRILRVKIRAGMFEKGLPSIRAYSGRSELLGSTDHREIAREAVRKSLVLMKNNDILPLQPNTHILVTGDGGNDVGKQSGGWTITWQGTGNTNDDFPGATSIFAGIGEAMELVNGSAEYSDDGSWIKKPDVAVVVFGEDPYAEGQGDIPYLNDPDNESTKQIFKKLQDEGIPIVSILLTGRPLWMNSEINSSDAFIVAWLPGSEGGGVADLIVSDKNGDPRYDFTGRLSFPWPKYEVNLENEALAVDEFILPLGAGMSYKTKSILPNFLSEKSSVVSEDVADIIFAGSTREPWKTYVGDINDWHRLVPSGVGKTQNGDLRLDIVDGNVQEDSLRVRWDKGYESQFYWQADVPADFSKMEEQGGALVMEFMINKYPEGTVTQRMDCGWPCRGEIDVTEFFKSIPLKQSSKIGISLSCFKKMGVDLKKITSPLVLVSKDEFSITFSDVRVVVDPLEENTIQSCDTDLTPFVIN